MTDGIDQVCARFGCAELVRRLAGADPEFRELCEDYAEMVAAQRRPSTIANRRELERLERALADEIRDRLRGDRVSVTG